MPLELGFFLDMFYEGLFSTVFSDLELLLLGFIISYRNFSTLLSSKLLIWRYMVSRCPGTPQTKFALFMWWIQKTEWSYELDTTEQQNHQHVRRTSSQKVFQKSSLTPESLLKECFRLRSDFHVLMLMDERSAFAKEDTNLCMFGFRDTAWKASFLINIFNW